MARKAPPPEYTKHKCHECAHAYDWHHLSVENIPTLAHCEKYINHPYCVIRSQQACKHFKPKTR